MPEMHSKSNASNVWPIFINWLQRL